MSTKVNEMGREIARILADYEGATVDTMKKAVDKSAKEAVSELKSTSPRRTGAYARDWAQKKEKQTNKWAYGKVVYNKKHYRLTHLLEKGHRKTNGGMVAARPHIAKVEQKAINTLVEVIKNDS